MNKRGISPLIAVVLLVGIAVVLGTMLLFFTQNLIGDQTEKSGNEWSLGQMCINDVNVVYKSESLCFSDEFGIGNEYINVTIQNRAKIPIEAFSFQVVGNGIKVSLREDILTAYSIKKYNMSVDTSDISDPENTPTESKDDQISNIEILVTKKINYQGIEGYCEKDIDELDINVIYHCSRSELP